MKDLILFGVQGSGKGTQANKILEAFPETFSYLSTGDVFRALIKGGENPIGQYITDTIQSGSLISDEITIAIFNLYFQTILASQDKAMLLDGYPRSQAQVDDLFRISQEQGRECIAINFILPEAKAIQRMLSRGRKDDNEASIQKRLQEYYTKTEPILSYAAKKMQVINIDADRDIETIFAEVKKVLT